MSLKSINYNENSFTIVNNYFNLGSLMIKSLGILADLETLPRILPTTDVAESLSLIIVLVPTGKAFRHCPTSVWGMGFK